MVSASGLSSYRQSMSQLSELAQGELTGFFGALDLGRPELARDALLEFTPALANEYGPIGAEIAVDWYDEQRADSGARGTFQTLAAASSVGADEIVEQTRFMAGKLWSPEPDAMLGGLVTNLDKWVRQPARDTIVWNSRRENVGWARVPSGSKTCSWCLVLASRDAVYSSAAAAGSRSRGGTEYHGKCDCEVVRMGSGDEYPAGYLPDDYYRMYEVAVDAAASDPEVQAFLDTLDPGDKNREMKGVTFAMRREFPEAVRDGIQPH